MFGVAVLAAVFTANGSYVSPVDFVEGLVPSMQLGAVVVGLGALAALALPGRAQATDAETADDRAESPVGVGEAPMATA